MRYAILSGSLVINTVDATPEFAQEQGWIELVDGAGIGWSYIDGQFIPPPAPDYSAQNKAQAETLLQQTDWVELSDVADPTNPPWLTNKAEFTTYRAALRMIAVNPPSESARFPTKPEEIWSTEAE